MKLLRSCAFLFLFTSVTSFASFNDVPSDHVFHESISFLETAGYVQGYEDGTFGPEKNITRSEFLKIIIEASQIPLSGGNKDLSAQFSDIPAGDAAWDIPYIQTALEKEIVKGYPDGTFQRNMPISYAEAAKILVETFELIKDPQDMCGLEIAALENPAWYAEDVCRMNRMIGNTSNNWRAPEHKITRGEMAQMTMYGHSFANIKKQSECPHTRRACDNIHPHASGDLSYGRSSTTNINTNGIDNFKDALQIPNGENMRVPEAYSSAWNVSLYPLDPTDIEPQMLEDICMFVKSRLLVGCEVKSVFLFENAPLDVHEIYSEMQKQNLGPKDAGGYILDFIETLIPQTEGRDIFIGFTRASVDEFGMGLTSYQQYRSQIGVVYMDNVVSEEERSLGALLYEAMLESGNAEDVLSPVALETHLQALQTLSVTAQLMGQTRNSDPECITGFAHPLSKIGGQFCPEVNNALNFEHRNVASLGTTPFTEAEKERIKTLWGQLDW